ncbi:MAG: ROK family protein [Limisphaerales bacterium]
MIVVPSRMGRLNKRALLARLQRLGLASRADLAKSLGMSQPTAGKIADELLAQGVIEEAAEDVASRNRLDGGAARLGRPARMLRLNRSDPRFIAVQLGVAETRLAALPVGADDEDCWAVAFETPGTAEAWVKRLRIAARDVAVKDCLGVLVSAPGIVDEPAGRVVFSPNLHWTEGGELTLLLQRVWAVPVTLVQEERALALGQQAMAPDNEDFLLVDFGEGVGGAVIVGGSLYHHPLPISGELGHTPVAGNLRPCGCGAVGCLETLASTRGLMLSLGESKGETVRTWADLQRHVTEVGIEPWLFQTIEATAMIVAGALNVLGLRRVVVTGSLSELPECALDQLRSRIVEGALWGRFGEVTVEAAPRRRTAGLVAVGIDRLVLPMTSPTACPPRSRGRRTKPKA